ncbi:MAG: DnaJ domain-containing protein [Verrucomicrobiota bacterium]
MTDYFALLEEPRCPWLEPDELKQKYHRLTLAAHPDTRSDSTPTDAFAELSKGYRTLSDPRQRLLHLLTLEGRAPATNAQVIPSDLADLFLNVGLLNQQIDLVARKLAEATSGLGKSMLTRDLLEIQTRVKDHLDRLRGIYDDHIDRLKNLNDIWTSNRARALSEVAEICGKITYLSRWIDQLEEKRVQLSLLRGHPERSEAESKDPGM